MTKSGSRSDIVVALAEEFIERYRNGERPPLKEYIERHPDLAEEICEVFPAMAMIEKIAIKPESLAEKADWMAAAPAFEQLGDYRIIREVGRGGMGIVYEAEQVSLGRHVALKVLPNKALLNAKHKRRFEREAKAAAKLHHTNIVPVFGVGEHEGLPYYVMQFIQGLGVNEVLAELIRQQNKNAPIPQPDPSRDVSAAELARSLLTGAAPTGEVTLDKRDADDVRQDRSTADSSISSNSSVVLPGQSDAREAKKQNYWQSVANVGVQVAAALDYAHSQGILHRDIKPSNLLLDRRGTVWVADFGLAKADDQGNLTNTGDILGTLRYMPPEAFEGKADCRSDVYSLGLTLYELLAMRPAFGMKDRHQLIQQVTTAEPPRLEILNPSIPRDLVTIIHKAIDRDAGHRYANAAELEADLRRFLNDEPIQARRISATERLRRWCRRRPAAAAAIAFAVLLLAALVALPLALAVSEARNAAALAKQKTKVDEALTVARRQSAVLALEQALGICAQGEVARGLLLLARGLQMARDAEADDLEQVFRWNLGAWSRENHELVHVLKHGAAVNAVAFSPDNKLVASGGIDSQVRLWDVVTGLPCGAPLVHPGHVETLVFHPDGRLLTGCADGAARLWDVTTGLQVGPTFVHHRGKLLVGSGKELPIDEDSPEGQIAAKYRGGQQKISTVALSPDGRHILTGGNDSLVHRWETASGKRLAGPLQIGGRILVAQFLSQGEHILVVGLGGLSRIWDVPTERVVLNGSTMEEPLSAVAIDPYASKFAIVNIWDHSVRQFLMPLDMPPVGTPPMSQSFIKPTGGLLQHRGRVNAIVYTPDGALLLSGSNDRTAKFWDAVSGRPFGSFLQHKDEVWAVAASPDNQFAVTGSKDGTARIWRISRGSKLHTLCHPGWVRGGPTFDSASKTVMTGSTGYSDAGRAVRWDVATGNRLGPLFAQRSANHYISGVALSPDDKIVYTADHRAQVVNFWDTDTGRSVGSTAPHGDELRRMEISPDGRILVTGAFNSGRVNGTSARLWDARTGQAIGEPLKHRERVEALAFRPDGKAVLTGSEDRTTRLWHTATGLPIGPPLQHPSGITAATYRHDGLAVVLGAADHTVQIWDTATWTPAGPAMLHDGEVRSVAYNSNGNLLLTSSSDSTARIWHVATGKPIGPALRHAQAVNRVSCSPSGRIAATSSDDKTAGLWAMPEPVTADANEIWRWAQRITGMTLGEGDAFQVLSPEEITRLGAAGNELDHRRPAAYPLSRDIVLLKALKGEPVIKDADDLMELARHAVEEKKIYTATAKMFRQNFKAHPDWIDAAVLSKSSYLIYTNRRYAINVAALAVSEDKYLTPGQKADWRHHAMDWMRAEIESWIKRLETATPQEAAKVLMVNHSARWPKALLPTDILDGRPAAERDAFRRAWAAAARLHAKAFAIDATLADNWRQFHRFNAACAAALAGCGPTNATDQLQDEERAHLRSQALQWLRADLAAMAKLAESHVAADRKMIQARCKFWQSEADLAGIRGNDALAVLPADESEAFRKLWADVQVLLEKTQK